MADSKQDQGASDKYDDTNSGGNTSGTGKNGYGGQNKTQVRVPNGEIKLRNGVTVAISPNRLGDEGNQTPDRTTASNAAQYRPGGGKGGIVSHFDQFFGDYLAEQEKHRLLSFSSFVEEIELGYAEEFFELEEDPQYEDWGEEDEEAEVYPVIHEAKGPCWSGYDMIGMKKKGNRKVPNCVPVKEEAEKGGRKVKLGKPFLTPGENKKRAVYVKNDKGNVVKVRFGDPNMRIKKSSPSHRKSFRARHGCDVNAGPRWKAKYWSCKMW